MLWKHQNIFAKSKGDLGVTDVIKHLKNTGDVVPIKQAARRFLITKRQVVKDELDKMSRSDVIEPSTGSLGIPCSTFYQEIWFFKVLHRQSSPQFSNVYSLPRIDDFLDALRGSEFFYT